jgi:DNA polymerase III epsilon subunit-like protein
MRKAPKGLLYDLETSYILAHTFSLYPERINHSNIVEDWRIHCASWKWLGEDRVYTAIEKDKDDKTVVEKLSKAINEADFLIAHNGIGFDIKKLNTRVIHHRLPPLPPVPTVDTLKEARALGAFTSNRLDYLGEYLGVGRKLHNSPSLWTKTFYGDKKALKDMAVYNVQDIHLLEEVYNELLPYLKKHPNYNVIMDTSDNCPRCGHEHLTKRGFSYTISGKKQRLQCEACGSWSVSSKLIHSSEVR